MSPEEEEEVPNPFHDHAATRLVKIRGSLSPALLQPPFPLTHYFLWGPNATIGCNRRKGQHPYLRKKKILAMIPWWGAKHHVTLSRKKSTPFRSNFLAWNWEYDAMHKCTTKSTYYEKKRICRVPTCMKCMLNQSHLWEVHLK